MAIKCFLYTIEERFLAPFEHIATGDTIKEGIIGKVNVSYFYSFDYCTTRIFKTLINIDKQNLIKVQVLFPFTEEHWENIEDYDSDIEQEINNAPSQPTPPEHNSNELVTEAAALATWIVLFLLRLQGKHYIPENAIDELIKFMSKVFTIMAKYSTFNSHFNNKFPTSLYMAKKITVHQYKSNVSSYFVCPECLTV